MQNNLKKNAEIAAIREVMQPPADALAEKINTLLIPAAEGLNQHFTCETFDAGINALKDPDPDPLIFLQILPTVLAFINDSQQMAIAANPTLSNDPLFIERKNSFEQSLSILSQTLDRTGQYMDSLAEAH